MTTSNNKHAIANRTTTSQKFIPLLSLITALSGASTISSHVTTDHQQDF